jgi:hypothetical protein
VAGGVSAKCGRRSWVGACVCVCSVQCVFVLLLSVCVLSLRANMSSCSHPPHPLPSFDRDAQTTAATHETKPAISHGFIPRQKNAFIKAPGLRGKWGAAGESNAEDPSLPPPAPKAESSRQSPFMRYQWYLSTGHDLPSPQAMIRQSHLLLIKTQHASVYVPSRRQGLMIKREKRKRQTFWSHSSANFGSLPSFIIR